MYAALDEVRRHVSEMTTTLMGDIPGLRIAIIAFGGPIFTSFPFLSV